MWVFWVVLCSGLVGCGPAEESRPRVVPRVKAFEVGAKASGQVRRISGTLAASNRSPLSFGVAGSVDRVLVSQGELIEEGQLLATLDAEPLRLAADEARAQLAGARAKLVEAQQSHQRAGQLLAAGGISEADFEVATSNLRSARASLGGAQSRVERAEHNHRHAELRAPFSGRIAVRSVEPFQEIGADDSAFLLQGGDRLKVKLLIPDALIRNVDYGQTVRVTSPTDPDVELTGVVSLIGAQAGMGSGFEVEVRLPPSEADLRPGMSARVTFNFDEYLEGRDIYLIPLSAVAVDVALIREVTSRDRLAPVFVFDGRGPSRSRSIRRTSSCSPVSSMGSRRSRMPATRSRSRRTNPGRQRDRCPSRPWSARTRSSSIG